MKLLELLDDLDRQVPVDAPVGHRCKLSTPLRTAWGTHQVAVAARIDPQGRRRDQYWCDGLRVERSVLLRLTCAESECPHAMQVRAQWLAHQRGGETRRRAKPPVPRPLMAEVALCVGSQHLVARPARFTCFTPCPNQAHPPMQIDKSGFDLFEDGACLGGGVAEVQGVRRPRLPSLRDAEAFVLARQLEARAALGAASDASRGGDGPGGSA